MLNTIVDITNIGDLPLGVLRARKGSPVLAHPKSGLLVVVGGHSFARAMLEIGFQLTNFKRFKFVDSREEAENYLRDRQT